MSTRIAKMHAEKLIEEFRIKKPPVNVKHIARTLGLEITEADLGVGVSGLLVTNAKTAHIFIQENDAETRKRFTISHEIGHFYLRHQFESGEHVHVDRGNFISQRGPQASTGVDPKEIEANQFAACLLMPSKMVQERVAALGGTALLDNEVSQLAKEFEVSEQAMTIRLTTLDLL